MMSIAKSMDLGESHFHVNDRLGCFTIQNAVELRCYPRVPYLEIAFKYTMSIQQWRSYIGILKANVVVITEDIQVL